ncbi:MAG: polysaccharide deacetylase family protein, partial [Acidimicrobiales bacterium]
MSPPGHGAFVISLDFELHWGVRDHLAADGPYQSNLLGVRQAIPAMLDLFGAYDIKATWATVGFLFCDNRGEVERYAPTARPAYTRPGLSPYEEPLGQDEAEDPIHFAPTLIDLIAATPGQEIATHTFSHFYCLEQGQDPETFRADLESAISVARKRGIELRSIVFPRNQFNPAYGAVLRDL